MSTLLAFAGLLCGLSVPQAAPGLRRPRSVLPAMCADVTFEAAVRHCEVRAAAAQPGPLSAEVPRLLRTVFEADFELLRVSKKLITNVTCMCPAEGHGAQLFDDELLALPLRPGRVCADGGCCEACSRVTYPALASAAECRAFRERLASVMVPASDCPHHNFYLKSSCASGDVRATLTYVRLLERMRRAVAHEWGLPLESVAPRQSFVSRIAGEADAERQSVHCDESSTGSFHYSAVLYLTSQAEDFEGGGFAFTDPAGADHVAAAAADDAGGGRVLSRLSPQAGTAVLFSSGWENVHAVEPVTSGERVAIPAFFVTKAAAGADASAAGAERPSAADAAADEARAATLWRALVPESEDDVRPLLADWHELLARAGANGMVSPGQAAR